MAKGMGTVDFQHKKLDLKPLFPVTAYFFQFGVKTYSLAVQLRVVFALTSSVPGTQTHPRRFGGTANAAIS